MDHGNEKANENTRNRTVGIFLGDSNEEIKASDVQFLFVLAGRYRSLTLAGPEFDFLDFLQDPTRILQDSWMFQPGIVPETSKMMEDYPGNPGFVPGNLGILETQQKIQG